MVKGFGTDIVDIKRIDTLICKYKSHFKSKVFTDAEIAYCDTMADPAIHYAGRWAVKEAFYKALPVTCQKISSWKSIEVITLQKPYGKPVISVCSDELKSSLETEGISDYHFSISHERKYCIASVILE